MSIYDFKVTAQNDSEVALSEYKGKGFLIVNTATGCGFTPHYDELQALYDAHQADSPEGHGSGKDGTVMRYEYKTAPCGHRRISCGDPLACAVRAAYDEQ